MTLLQGALVHGIVLAMVIEVVDGTHEGLHTCIVSIALRLAQPKDSINTFFLRLDSFRDHPKAKESSFLYIPLTLKGGGHSCYILQILIVSYQ